MGNPNWKKGVSANPAGKPKGARTEATILRDTLHRLEKNIEEAKAFLCACQCTTIREHFTKRAFQDDKVLVAYMKKIEPDLTQETGQKAPSVINIVYGHLQPKAETTTNGNRIQNVVS